MRDRDRIGMDGWCRAPPRPPLSFLYLPKYFLYLPKFLIATQSMIAINQASNILSYLPKAWSWYIKRQISYYTYPKQDHDISSIKYHEESIKFQPSKNKTNTHANPFSYTYQKHDHDISSTKYPIIPTQSMITISFLYLPSVE